MMLVGKIQLGFRTMSSKVGFGEKNTPMIRPKGEMEACGPLAEAWDSGVGIGVVATEISFGASSYSRVLELVRARRCENITSWRRGVLLELRRGGCECNRRWGGGG